MSFSYFNSNIEGRHKATFESKLYKKLKAELCQGLIFSNFIIYKFELLWDMAYLFVRYDVFGGLNILIENLDIYVLKG